MKTTNIDHETFIDCPLLHTLTITGSGDMPDYLDLDQPWYSFNHTIKRVYLDNTITSIGRNAFFNCKSISIILIPQSK